MFYTEILAIFEIFHSIPEKGIDMLEVHSGEMSPVAVAMMFWRNALSFIEAPCLASYGMVSGFAHVAYEHLDCPDFLELLMNGRLQALCQGDDEAWDDTIARLTKLVPVHPSAAHLVQEFSAMRRSVPIHLEDHLLGLREAASPGFVN